MTTIAAVNATGILRAKQDARTHVSVYPVDFSKMPEWLASWQWADFEPHPYTEILANIVYTPGEELAD